MASFVSASSSAAAATLLRSAPSASIVGPWAAQVRRSLLAAPLRAAGSPRLGRTMPPAPSTRRLPFIPSPRSATTRMRGQVPRHRHGAPRWPGCRLNCCCRVPTQLFLASGAACFLVLGVWSCLLLDLICGWWPPWPLEIFGISIHLFAARMKMDVFRSIDPGMSEEEEAQRYGDGGGIGGYADAKPATSLLRFKQLHGARDIHSGSFVHMLDPSCNLLELMIKDVHSLQPVDVLQDLQYGVGMCP